MLIAVQKHPSIEQRVSSGVEKGVSKLLQGGAMTFPLGGHLSSPEVLEIVYSGIDFYEAGVG